MTKRSLVILGMLLILSFCGCAGLRTSLSGGEKITQRDTHVMVFPLRNPYYKGKEIGGIGQAFAAALVSAVQASGRTCRLADTNIFSAQESTDTNKACRYADENDCSIAITGLVTEWLDGATQWSGKVDVAAVTLYAYDTQTHLLLGSASGRQNGQWFTFVNAPTTRFLEPLSQKMVKTLFN